LGFTISCLGKDTITQTLIWGKGFEERSISIKIIMVSFYFTFFTIIFYLLFKLFRNTLLKHILKFLRTIFETITNNKNLEYLLFNGLFLLSIGMAILPLHNNLSSNISYDETLYFAHMRLIMLGNIPYQDFFDWVPPVWLYLYVFFFNVFGASIVVARLLSTILGITSILLLVRLSWKLSGRWSAIITLSMIACINPLVIELVRYYYTSSAVFFLIVGITIEEAFPKASWKVVLVELFFVLAAGTVQAFGLTLILYPLYQYFIIKDIKQTLLALIAGIIFCLSIALPFLLIDWQATFWAMFSYNREIIPMRWHYSLGTYLKYYFNSILKYASIWFPIIAAIGYCLWSKFMKLNVKITQNFGSNNIVILLWLIFFGIALPVFLFNPVLSLQQHVYYLPVAVILTANIICKFMFSIKTEWKMMSILILILTLIYSAVPAMTNIDINLKQTTILSGSDDLKKVISTTKRLIKDIPDAKVFTLVPYFGLEADAKIFPGTEYGITSLTLNWDNQKAKRYNFFTGSQALEWIETGQPDLIILVDKSMRTMDCCGPKNGITFLNHLEETVARNYTLTDSFVVNSYWGEARFFTRKVKGLSELT
jgi:hypothetical protein